MQIVNVGGQKPYKLATIQNSENSHLMPHDANKDIQSRLALFIQWLDDNGFAWFDPQLSAYRDYIMSNKRTKINRDGKRISIKALSERSAQSHLSTIRGVYNKMLRSNEVRDYFASKAQADGITSVADTKAFIDEWIVRLRNAIDPIHSEVKAITIQDKNHLRLSVDQCIEFLSVPMKCASGHDLKCLRDSAIVALLLCTGIREAELVNLEVADLEVEYEGMVCLHVQSGKGKKQRYVPYGDLIWCLQYVKAWLRGAGIELGAVFRGVYRGGKSVRPTRITTRAVNALFASEEMRVLVNGSMVNVEPHDLRRTYAKLNYLAGMDIVRLKQNLGHSSVETTEKYIGDLNASERMPKMRFSLPESHLEVLNKWIG